MTPEGSPAAPVRQVSRPIKWLSAAGMHASVVAGMLLTLFVVLSAFMRYVIGAPFYFSDELVGLLTAATFLLALPNGLVDNTHLRITLIVDRMPPLGRAIAEAAATLILVAFAAVFMVQAYDFTIASYNFGSRSEMAEILLYPWMAMMPAAFALMIVVVANNVLAIMLGVVARRDGNEG